MTAAALVNVRTRLCSVRHEAGAAAGGRRRAVVLNDDLLDILRLDSRQQRIDVVVPALQLVRWVIRQSLSADAIVQTMGWA